jgi:hypothetical protein
MTILLVFSVNIKPEAIMRCGCLFNYTRRHMNGSFCCYLPRWSFFCMSSDVTGYFEHYLWPKEFLVLCRFKWVGFKDSSLECSTRSQNESLRSIYKAKYKYTT